jgi:DNA-binding Lrp family transcriptional regulator
LAVAIIWKKIQLSKYTKKWKLKEIEKNGIINYNRIYCNASNERGKKIMEILRENEYIYIVKHSHKNGLQYYNAIMKGMSVSSIGIDIDTLEKEFTEYVKNLIKGWEK